MMQRSLVVDFQQYFQRQMQACRSSHKPIGITYILFKIKKAAIKGYGIKSMIHISTKYLTTYQEKKFENKQHFLCLDKTISPAEFYIGYYNLNDSHTYLQTFVIICLFT